MTDASARRAFGPVVLLGVLAGVGLAVAGTQPWFGLAGEDPADCQAPCVGISYADAGVVSAANALALVALACWGVLLVTRGRVRRVVAVLGLLAAVGGLVSVIVSSRQTAANVREAAEQVGIAAPEVTSTGWYWIGAAASILGLLAWVGAVRFVRDWPEMGRRYDTPSDNPPEDLWKAMDRGHDPTS